MQSLVYLIGRLSTAWRARGFALILIAIAISSRADEAVKQSFPAVAIEGAKIVVKPGKVIENGTIVIRRGVITEISEKAQTPFDAQVIDGKGLTAYPGFIDASGSIGVPKELEKQRRSGSGDDIKIDLTRGALAPTREVNRKGIFPDFVLSQNFKIDAKDATAWRGAGFAAANTAPVDGILAGSGALILILDEEDAPRRDAVILPKSAMMAGWRAAGPGYPRALMGSIAHLRQTLLDAQRYGESWKLFNESKDHPPRPVFDAALDALQPALRGETPVVFPASFADEIHRALNLAKEFNLKPIIEGGAFAYKTVDRLKAEHVPLLLHIDLPDKPKPGAKQLDRVHDIADRFAVEIPKEAEEAAAKADQNPKIGEPDREYQDRLRIWNERAANAKVLAVAGIPFAISTRGNKDIKKFQENLVHVIEAGLTPDATLSALTSAPAEIFGLAENLGTLETGRYGNVTLIEGAFGDKKAKARFVVAGGKVYDLRKAEEAAKEIAKAGEKKDDAAKEAGADEKEKSEEKAKSDEKPWEKSGDEKKAKEPPKAEWAIETDADRVPKTHTGGNVLIKNATILTMTKGTLENTSILVKDGVITEIGPHLSAPKNAAVIDGAGAWVIPGIIDCHSHMAIAGGVNEATDSITAMCRIEDVVRGDDVTIYRAAAGGVTAANLLHGSANTIGGQRAIVQMKYNQPVSELFFKGFPRGIKFALGENVTRSRTRFPNTRMGVEATIRRAFIQAQAYRREWDEYNALSKKLKAKTLAPRRDLRLEALAGVLDGSILVHCHSYNEDEIAMLLGILEEFGVKNLTLEHALEAYKIAPEVASFGNGGAFVSTFADNWAYKIEAFDAIPYNAAVITEAGGTAIMNSDSGERVRRLNLEAAKAVRFGGLSYQDALRTVTLNPARALHINSQVGSIEIGKRADLALWNGHPLSVYARCFMTLIGGEVVFERPGEHGGPFPLVEKKRGDLPIASPKNEKGSYAIVHATIDPITSSPIDDGTIVFGNGKIVAVGKDVKVPDGAAVIDGKGLQVYPGFIDGGSALGLNEIAALFVTNDASEGGYIQPDLKAAVAIKPDSELIPVARFTGITSTVARPAGGLIPGQSSLVQLDGWTPKEMAYVPRLALEMIMPPGAGRVDLAALFNREEGAAAPKRPTSEEQIRKIKDLFERARQYERSTGEAKKRGAKMDFYEPDLEALGPYVRKELPVVIDASGAADILEAISLVNTLQVKAILRGCDDGWKVADKIAATGLPVIIGPVWTLPEEQYDPYDAAFANAAKLKAAGVKICFQSASESDARNLPFEAGMAVAFGLPRAEALKAMTINTAEIFGVADRVGSLEPGKRADIIVSDGDPLEVVSDLRYMFINGNPVDLRDNKHTRLYEKYRARIPNSKRPAAPIK